MKILYHHRTRSKDGQNVHIVELTGALRERGHEIVMVGPAAMETSEFGADAGLVAALKRYLPAWLYEIAELLYSVPAYVRLRRAYLEHRPDCLYERYNLFLPTGVWLKRRFGIPMLSEVNAPLVEERSRFSGLSLVSLARWSERTVWRNADYVLPVTDVLAQHVRDAGVADDRIVVVPNGINLAHFARAPAREDAKARLGLDGTIVLGFTGFIRSWHGLDRVIDLIADSDPGRRLHFLVVGDGPARADLETQVAARGVGDRVTFAGLVDRDRITDYVAAFDIALQPDVVLYASPLKLFEYMMMGCAIVAPDTPNIREVVTDRQSALLFDRDSDAAFRAAIESVCSDDELRGRLGSAARSAIDEKGLTWGTNAARVEALIDGLRRKPDA